MQQDFSASFGKWTWKEEGKTLEFVPNNPSAERKKQADRRQPKAHGIVDRGRTSPATGKPKLGLSQKNIGMLKTEDKLDGYLTLQQRQQMVTSKVTVELVKSVAFDMMMQQERKDSVMFEELYGTPEFDKFLLCLFNYIHCYLEKKAYEEKPNPMNIERSKKEMAQHAELCKNMDKAQKIMGQAYGALILGLGMQQYHHMHCGQSRVSNTRTDRGMFETLYAFTTFSCWVVFKRPDFQTVKKELNRILRSETFNPAIRIKHAEERGKNSPAAQSILQAESTKSPKETKKDANRPTTSTAKDGTQDAEGEKSKDAAMEVDDDEEQTQEVEKSTSKHRQPKGSVVVSVGPKITPAEYRRMMEKRPPIKTIISQRSPAVISMLPTAKEDALWLFKKMNTTDCLESSDSDEELLDVSEIDVKELQTGIIGQPMIHFNPQTLLPKGGENEEEGEEGGEDGEARNGAPPPGSSNSQETFGSNGDDVHTDDAQQSVAEE